MDCDENFVLARRWPLSCLEEHSCFTSPIPSKLPTRLLFLGSSNDEVRLVTTESISLQVGYLTLSHCWGSSSMPKFQNGKIQELVEHVPFDWFSNIFHNAILVTRRLRFLYIYTDALCIVQDNPEDVCFCILNESGLLALGILGHADVFSVSWGQNLLPCAIFIVDQSSTLPPLSHQKARGVASAKGTTQTSSWRIKIQFCK